MKAITAKELKESAELPLDTTFDVFLSHRAIDIGKVSEIAKHIRSVGYTVYIDSEIDLQMDRSTATRITAATIKERMNHSQCLFFVTSEHYTQSVWMPCAQPLSQKHCPYSMWLLVQQ